MPINLVDINAGLYWISGWVVKPLCQTIPPALQHRGLDSLRHLLLRPDEG